jgi:general secretion pathway protein D
MKGKGAWGRIGMVALFAWLGAVWHAEAQRPTGTGRAGAINRGATGGARNIGAGGAFGSSGSRAYAPVGTVGEAMVSSDPETRRLIVITDDDTSQFISQVITNLDRPKPQVLIKVVFLEVTYNKGFDLGIEGAYSKDFGGGKVGTFQNNFGMAAQGVNPVPPGAGLYQLMGADFTATLRAIAEAGKTEVLSRPSILARNNQQAVITVGQEIPLITDSRFDQNNNQINTIQYQDIGIILRVTPFITADGQVEMIVSPEISNLTDQSIPIAGGNNPVTAPVIAKRSADTVIVTADGQTVIIGGLMANRKTVNDSKIPFLGDIPGLGLLFRRRVNETTKTELMIFLTPHIVAEQTQLAGLTAREKQDLELLPRGFTEQELNKFIDGLPRKDVIPPYAPKKEAPPPAKPQK